MDHAAIRPPGIYLAGPDVFLPDVARAADNLMMSEGVEAMAPTAAEAIRIAAALARPGRGS